MEGEKIKIEVEVDRDLLVQILEEKYGYKCIAPEKKVSAEVLKNFEIKWPAGHEMDIKH